MKSKQLSPKELCEKMRQLEIALEEAQTRLRETTTSLEGHEGLLELAMKDMREMYEEKLRAQSQLTQSDKLATIGLLTAGIAHEINNPLATLQLVFTMLLNHTHSLRDKFQRSYTGEADNPSLFKEIEEVTRQGLLCVTAMTKIVKDIRMFSRSDKGVKHRENLNTILDSVIGIAWNALKNKVQLKKEYGDIPLVECNPQQLSQVFLNLIVNASQAIEQKGTITLRTFVEKDAVKTQITDTGCGIPKEIMEKIFEPFFTTKGEEKGTGLGLSITVDIIKKHNGKIEVESQVGKGTCFTVSLPAQR